MQRYELDAWLGDEHSLTEDQIVDLLSAADDIAARYPDDDDAADREVALLVAYRLLVEDAETVVTEYAGKLSQARRSERAALVALRQAAMSLVRPGARKGDGVASAAGFAVRASVDRQAVLTWIGRR